MDQNYRLLRDPARTKSPIIRTLLMWNFTLQRYWKLGNISVRYVWWKHHNENRNFYQTKCWKKIACMWWDPNKKSILLFCIQGKYDSEYAWKLIVVSFYFRSPGALMAFQKFTAINDEWNAIRSDAPCHVTCSQIKMKTVVTRIFASCKDICKRHM